MGSAQQITSHPDRFAGQVVVFVEMNVNFFVREAVAVVADRGVKRLAGGGPTKQAGKQVEQDQSVHFKGFGFGRPIKIGETEKGDSSLTPFLLFLSITINH